MDPRLGGDDVTADVLPYLPTTPEVCRTIGASYRTVDHWIRRGVLAPAVPAGGSGTIRRWTPGDVADAILASAILDVLGPGRSGAARPPLAVAYDLLTHWRASGRPSGYLVASGTAYGHSDRLDDALTVLDRGYPVAIFPTPDLRGTR